MRVMGRDGLRAELFVYKIRSLGKQLAAELASGAVIVAAVKSVFSVVM
jgi:hypothetical protein